MDRSGAHELEWSRAQEIVVSVDLVKAAKRQLRFLATVDNIGCLYDGAALDHAIYRYKYCWLPLLAKHVESPITTEPLVVPLDCEWIWHCHRLNPVRYKVDCEEIYGRILGIGNVLSTTEGACTRQTEQIWNHMYPSEPYHLEKSCHHLVTHIDADIEPRESTKYDLVAAVKRQSSFFRKVSDSITDDERFLEKAVANKGFLHLIRRIEEGNIKCSCVPTYEIDLMWHSHLLNPVSYCKDLTSILGKIANHNDRGTSNNSSKELPVANNIKNGPMQTIKLWEDTFGREYSMAGSTMKDDARSLADEPSLMESASCDKCLYDMLCDTLYI